MVSRANVGRALIEGPGSNNDWAFYLITHALAQVGLMERVDTALPGVLLKPADNYHEGRLFRFVRGALYSYVASAFSAPMGDPAALLAFHRDALRDALRALRANCDEAKQTVIASERAADLFAAANQGAWVL